MAIEKIRLSDGTEINVEEWLQWPLFSSCLGKSDETDGAGGDVRLFEYIVGDEIPTMGVFPTATMAGVTDTNQVVRGKINHDEGFICFNVTYEAFGESTKEYASDKTAAPKPLLDGANLRRLQRDILVRLVVGAGISKAQIEAPLEDFGQGVGAVAFGSGNDIAAGGGVTVSLDYGTAGPVTPHNQRRAHLPVKIDADRDMYVSLSTPGGKMLGVDQDWRLRLYLDGLKRRPVA